MKNRAKIAESLNNEWRKYHPGECRILDAPNCQCHLCLIEELAAASTNRAEIISEFVEGFKKEYGPYGDCDHGCYEMTIEALECEAKKAVVP